MVVVNVDVVATVGISDGDVDGENDGSAVGFTEGADVTGEPVGDAVGVVDRSQVPHNKGHKIRLSELLHIAGSLQVGGSGNP